MPAIIGLDKRSEHNPSAESAAIERALQLAGGTKVPIPIYHRRKHLGWTLAPDGIPGWLPRTWRYRAGFTDYDDIISEISAGKRLPIHWYKNANSASAATSNFYDSWTLSGSPTGGSNTGTASTARQFDDSSAGAIQHGGDVSADTKHILTVGGAWNQSAASILIYDRVMSYDQNAFNANSATTMDNTLTAQRYNGSGLSGMQIMITAGTTQFQAGGTTLNALTYTNQSGTAARSTGGSVIFISGIPAADTSQAARIGCPASSGATITWGPFLFLQSEDWGVRSVETYTTAAAITGKFTLVLARPLFWIPIPAAAVPAQVDAVVQISSLERIYDGACLAAVYAPASTTSGYLNINMEVGWG